MSAGKARFSVPVNPNDVPLTRVPEAVLGREPAVPRAEAMALLASSDHPRRVDLLDRVLEDPGEERRYRLVAAITLGRIQSEEAETALLGSLEPDHPAVHEVLQSLGRIGGPEALKAIEALRLPEGHHARAAQRFAASLISYRLGLEGHALSLPDPERVLAEPQEEVRTVHVEPLRAEAATVVVQALERYPHGIVLDPSASTMVECAGEVNVFVLNRAVAAGEGGARILGERKLLLGVGALRSPETGDYSVSYLVFAHPLDDGRVALIATRCSGRFALVGTGRFEEGGALAFELRAVRHPGARAVFIRGRLVDGRVEVDEARSTAIREPPREPAYREVGRDAENEKAR